MQYAKLPQRIRTRDSKQIRPRLVLPSSFCSLANAGNSVYDFIFLPTTIRHVHTKTFVFYDYCSCYFLPATLAASFIAVWRVMTNRFRALTSGWMWFIGERCRRSFREPITEIWVTRTFDKLHVLLGHIFPGTKIISVNVWKMNGYAIAFKRNLLLESHRLFLFSFKAIWK